MRRSVVGEKYVDKALANGATEFSRPGQELVTGESPDPLIRARLADVFEEWCWGFAWTRPGLERRDRSLINIGMLMALNRGPELAVHVRGARNNGLSELEIREAIIHATTYCGVPSGVSSGSQPCMCAVLTELRSKRSRLRNQSSMLWRRKASHDS